MSLLILIVLTILSYNFFRHEHIYKSLRNSLFKLNRNALVKSNFNSVKDDNTLYVYERDKYNTHPKKYIIFYFQIGSIQLLDGIILEKDMIYFDPILYFYYRRLWKWFEKNKRK